MAAHPDDEVLGCGGTIARMAAEGTCVHIAILADGVSARAPDARPDPASARTRRGAAERPRRYCGASSSSSTTCRTTAWIPSRCWTITKRIEALIARHRAGYGA